MSRLKDRIRTLETHLIRPEVKHIFIGVVGKVPSGWECLQTGARVERLPGEDDEALQARAIQADDEARQGGASDCWPISVFRCWGPGWSQ